MKALWFLIGSAVVILTWHTAYRAGQKPMRMFEALCESPGVRCVVEVSPAYFRGQEIPIPAYTVGEWARDDGRMQ